MKRLIFIFMGIILSAWQCSENELKMKECAVPATIRDLTGFDGCGWVFELEDGSRVEPVRVYSCGTPPVPENLPEDVLANFELVDGKEVFISFEEINSPSICMVGKTVKITCIRDKDVTFED